jgi:hypothetical protein
MLVLSKDSTDDEILNAIRHFVELLAEEKYSEVYEKFLPAPDRQLTPEVIKALIEGYGFAEPVEENDEPPLHVTSLCQMTEPEPKGRQQVDWFSAKDERILGGAYYDLPLNGEWSDLTAIFDIIKVPDGIALSLDDIHVL